MLEKPSLLLAFILHLSCILCIAKYPYLLLEELFFKYLVQFNSNPPPLPPEQTPKKDIVKPGNKHFLQSLTS